MLLLSAFWIMYVTPNFTFWINIFTGVAFEAESQTVRYQHGRGSSIYKFIHKSITCRHTTICMDDIPLWYSLQSWSELLSIPILQWQKTHQRFSTLQGCFSQKYFWQSQSQSHFHYWIEALEVGICCLQCCFEAHGGIHHYCSLSHSQHR